VANRKILLPLVLGAVIVVLAGCGSSSKTTTTAAPAATSTTTSTPTSAPAAGGGQTLALAADPSGALKYDKKALAAKAGKVTIDFTNKAPLSHNVTIQKGTSGAPIGATPTFAGGTKSLTVSLTPGTYTFYCTVPGHRAAGMVGVLVVK
jgi:plastocyanin